MQILGEAINEPDTTFVEEARARIGTGTVPNLYYLS